MSEYIDERIVSIKFDNSGFAEGVSETQKQLDSLNKSLEFEGANEGGKALANTFKDISNEVKKTDLSPLGNAVENVGNKFHALQTIASGVFLKIGMDAVETGKKLIKSFTIDPISSGFEKYQSILTSQMTLTAALGGKTEEEIAKNEKKISDVLAELTWYADETSYSLDDMIKNVSQFANYGVDLNDAKVAIMGIANASAKSGAPLAMASHAMEGFSKAMGQGYMSYQTWRTWLNSSKITTLDFKNTMIETAKEFLKQGAVLSDKVRLYGDSFQYYASKEKGWVDITAESIEESLTKGQWLTNDVMLAGLAKYSAAMGDLYEATDKGTKSVSSLLEMSDGVFDTYSTEAFKYAQQCKTLADVIDSLADATSTTWNRIFQSLIGDYKQTVDLWSNFAEYLFEWFVYPLQDVAAMIKKFAESSSNIMDETGKKALTMREVIVGSFMNILEAIQSVINPIKEAFNAVFNPLETLPGILQNGVENFYSFTESLILTDEKADKLKTTFISIFSALKTIWTIIKRIVTSIKNNLFPIVKKVSEYAVKIISAIAKVLFKLISTISTWISKTFGVRDLISDVKQDIIDAAYEIDKMTEAAKQNEEAFDALSKKHTNYNELLDEQIKKSKAAKNAMSDLAEEEEKESQIKEKDYTISGGYDGSSYMSYYQALEKENNANLTEVIKKNKITEDQYNTVISLMQKMDAGANITYNDILDASNLSEDAFGDLYKTLKSTTVAFKKTDTEISKIVNSNAEPSKWETILDGINEAEKETMLLQGDADAIIKMYYHDSIKDHKEIAEAVGVQVWQVRELISAYEEAYAVEKKLAEQKKEATADNIDQIRQELGYIKRTSEEEVMSVEEAWNKIQTTREAAYSDGYVSLSESKEIAAARKEWQKAKEYAKKQAKELPKISTSVSDLIDEASETVIDTGAKTTAAANTLKDTLGSVSNIAKETGSVIADSSEKTAQSVSGSAEVISDALKKVSSSSKDASKDLQQGIEDAKKKSKEKQEEEPSPSSSLGDKVTEWFDETTFENDKNKFIEKFNSIWIEISKAYKQFSEEFDNFFDDPFNKLKDAIETAKGLLSSLKDIIFPKKDEAGVAGASKGLDKKSFIDVVIESLKKVRDFLNEPIHWDEFWNIALLNHEVKVMSKILKNFSNAVDIKGSGDDILKIGAGIGILVGALFAMSKIDNKAVDEALDLFERLAWIIGLLTGGITAIMAIYNVSSVKNIPTAIESVLTKVFGGKSVMEQVSDLIVEVSKALAIMVASMAGLMLVINYVKPDAVSASIAIMTAFLIVIFGLMVFMAEMNKQYNTTVNQKEFKALSANINIMNSSGTVADIMKEFANALIRFVAAFLIITKVVDTYFIKDNGDFDLAKFSIVSGILIGMLAGIMLLADVMVELQKKMKKTKFDYKQIKAISKIIDPMVHGLIIFVAAFWAINKIVSNMPDGTLGPTIGIFAAMIGALIGLVILMVNASKKMTPKGATKLKDLSKAIDLMSLSIIIIAGSLSAIFLSASIAELSSVDYVAIGAILAAIIGALISLIALILSNAKKISSKEAKNMTTMAKAIDLISASILIIALGVSSVFLSLKDTNLDGTDYLGIGTILITAIAILALITVYLVKESQKMSLKDANRLKDLGKVMLMIGGALTLVMLGVAAVISAFAEYDSSQASKLTGRPGGGGGGTGGGNIGEAGTGSSGLIWGIVAIVGIFAIMIAELAIIAKKLNPEDAIIIKALGVAMIEIGAAVALIGLTIGKLAQDLSRVNPEAMKASLITIGVILGVLVALFGIIAAVIAATGGATGAGATSMAAAVAVLGGLAAVLLLVSASVYVLAKAIEEMVVAITAVGEANDKLISGLETIRDAMPILKDIIIETVKAIVVGVIQAITESVAEIAKSIVECFVNILEIIAENGPKILKALEEIAPIILKVITLVLKLVLQALTEAMPQFREWFMKLLNLVEEAIGDLLQFLIDEAIPKLEEIIGMILAFLLDEVLPQLQTAITNFVIWLGDLGETIVDSLARIWAAIHVFIVDELFPAIQDIWKQLLNLIDSLISDFLTFLENGIVGWGHQIISIIVSLIDTIGDGVQDILSALERFLLKVADGLYSFFETGGAVLAKLILIPKAIWDGFSGELKKKFGITDNGEPETGGGIYNIGKKIIEAFLKGLESMGGLVKKMALKVWDWFKNTFTGKKGADTASPSKAMEKVGKYVGQGFVKGVDKTTPEVAKSALTMWEAFETPMSEGLTTMSKGVIDSASDIFTSFGKESDGMKEKMKDFSATTSAMLSQLLDANMDFNPVITPVFDMSNLDLASSSMTDFFDSQKAFDVSASFSTMKGTNANLFNQNMGENQMSTNGATYNFTQNNYSPKALSEIEIYRRTNNQLNFQNYLA